MDNYKSHLTTGSVNAIAKTGSEMMMLPANMTSKLQLMDYGYNAPFKANIVTRMNAWLSEDPQRASTPVNRKQISQWAEESWYGIPMSTCANSLRAMGYIHEVEALNQPSIRGL